MPIYVGNATVNTSITSSNLLVMSPQSFQVTNSLRNTVRPSMSLNFVESQTLDPRISFTRAGSTRISSSYFNSLGSITTVASNTPRFDYDPSTLACLGLLIEPNSSNILLNSASLSTQSVTTTAATYTLSFYGTGTVTLSGTYSGSLVGSGAFPTRSTLTFTATAGTLTLTVSGTVSYAQLENLAFATSWIPTVGASITRGADQVVISGTNLSSWYNPSAGTIVAGFDVPQPSPSGVNHGVFRFDTGTDGGTGGFAADGIFLWVQSGTSNLDAKVSSSTSTPSSVTTSINTPTTPGVIYQSALAYTSTGFNIAINAVLVGGPYTMTAAPNNITRLLLGDAYGSAVSGTWPLSGHLQKLVYYPAAMSNTQLIAMTS